MPIKTTGFACAVCHKLYGTKAAAASCEEHHRRAGKVFRAVIEYCKARQLPYGTTITVNTLPEGMTMKVDTPDSSHVNANLSYYIEPDIPWEEE